MKRPFAHDADDDATLCDDIVTSFKNEKPNETALLHITLHNIVQSFKMKNQMKRHFVHDATRFDDIVPSFKNENALLHMTLHDVTMLYQVSNMKNRIRTAILRMTLHYTTQYCTKS